jgi:hypothetical protein
MNSHIAWLIIATAAFASGAWWQYAGCELKQSRGQEQVLTKDAGKVETLQPAKQKGEREHEKTITIIKTSPDSCIHECIPSAILERLRYNGPACQSRPTVDGRLPVS